MMKRILITVIAGALLLSGVGGCGSQTKDSSADHTSVNVTSEKATVAEGADSDWYMDVLADPSIKEKYPYYKFIDVNGDGVPILILSSTQKSFIGAEDKAQLILYSDGSPKTVMDLGGAGGERFYFNEEEGTLTYFSRLSGESHIQVYCVNNGTLEEVTRSDEYGPHHYTETDNDETVYLQDGKEITEEACQALWDKYANDNDEVTYELIP